MPPSGKKLALLLVVFCLAGAACAVLYNRYFPATGPRLEEARSAAGEAIDLTRPDMLIRSSSLAKLPSDLLRLPLAKDLLTEDIVNYYEHHEGKLALSGTLRRIAYENKLELPDRLIEMALDAPAEVALWSDGRGRLRHFAVFMRQNALARAVTLLLPLHSKVTVSKPWPEIQASSLILAYGNKKLSLFTRGDRVAMLSDGLLAAAMAAGGSEEQADDSAGIGNGDAGGGSGEQRKEIAAIVDGLLAEDAGQPSVFAKSFNLSNKAPEKGHEMIIAARALAFGYEYFTPGLVALRLVFDDAGSWQSAVLLDDQAATAAYAPLWRALPLGAAFCAALPADWAALDGAAKRWREQTGDSEQLGAVLAKFGPAAICWYGGSRLYTPLFAAVSERKLTETEKEALLRLSQAATKIGQAERSLVGPEGGMWQGSLPSAYGVGGAGKEQADKRFLHPAAAVWAFGAGAKQAADIALFSPDAALVTRALDVAAKKFPALADSAAFPENDQVLALINPAILAEFMRGEILRAAPEGGSENFLDVVDFLFTPRLNALAAYAPQAVSFRKEKSFFTHAAAGRQWYPLRWNRIEELKFEAASVGSAAATETIQP